jgi:hypothetical protein
MTKIEAERTKENRKGHERQRKKPETKNKKEK